MLFHIPVLDAKSHDHAILDTNLSYYESGISLHMKEISFTCRTLVALIIIMMELIVAWNKIKYLKIKRKG